MFGRLLHKLDLTEAQEDLIVEAKANMKQRHKASRTGRRAAFETVAAELAKKQPDRARLHALIDQQVEAMKKNMHAGLDDMLKVHESLTDEQRAELVRQVERKREHRRMMKGEE
jgi:Spy/CpxP family protein refolding chaperone